MFIPLLCHRASFAISIIYPSETIKKVIISSWCVFICFLFCHKNQGQDNNLGIRGILCPASRSFTVFYFPVCIYCQIRITSWDCIACATWQCNSYTICYPNIYGILYVPHHAWGHIKLPKWWPSYILKKCLLIIKKCWFYRENGISLFKSLKQFSDICPPLQFPPLILCHLNSETSILEGEWNAYWWFSSCRLCCIPLELVDILYHLQSRINPILILYVHHCPEF